MTENDDKQKRELYFDELLLFLLDAFSQISRFFFFYLDLQVFGLLGLRGLFKVGVSHYLYRSSLC